MLLKTIETLIIKTIETSIIKMIEIIIKMIEFLREKTGIQKETINEKIMDMILKA